MPRGTSDSDPIAVTATRASPSRQRSQLPFEISVILIGYSGARASRAPGAVYPRPIKLLVGYDLPP